MKVKTSIALIVLIYFFSSTLSAQTKGWGRNDSGQVGLGNAVDPQPNPVSLGPSGDDVTGINGGQFHTLFLKADGSVQATGSNNSGQLGDGTTNTRTTLEAVADLSNVIAVSAGLRHSLALLSNGTIMAWGRTIEGQLGGGGAACDPSSGYCLTPGVIPGLSNIVAIDAGRDHSLALRSDGTVWAWGRNDGGQIGNGTIDGPGTFQPVVQVGVGVTNFSGLIAISGGEAHSLALKSDGTVWVWGNNLYGAIGDGTTGGIRPLPVQNGNISGVSQIAAGFNFNVALKPDGTVFAWGFNIRGNIGNGTDGPAVTTPTQTSITEVIDIKTAGGHTMAKKSDGSIWAWGWNQNGELGIGTASSTGCACSSTPVQTLTGVGNPVFGAGSNHSFAGKPSATLQPGSSISILGDDLNILFSSLSSVTTVTILAISPSSTGLTVASGTEILLNSPAYSITATPNPSGSIVVCLRVRNVFSQTQFARLRLLHGEGSELVDRTILPNNYQKREVCGSVTSLSPFVIGESLAPTAANVSVAGRVSTAAGTGIAYARVTLTRANGETRTAITSPFGYYRMDNVLAGETYILNALHKRYSFSPQIVTVLDELSELNLTAENEDRPRSLLIRDVSDKK